MQLLGEEESSNSLQNFTNAIDSPFTEKTYKNSIKLYLQYHNNNNNNTNLKDYDSLLKIDKETTFNMIRDFIVFQRKTKLRSRSRINIHLAAIRLFYSVNRYEGIIDWFTLARFKGKERKRMVNDKSYTRQEISKLLEFADLRMKVAILVMVSTGIRVGGLACLKIKDLEYIEQYKLYRIFIYSEHIDDTYYTFCTPECASFIKLYLETRERQYGEILKPESPLIRKDIDSAKNLSLPSHSIQERIRLIVLESGVKIKTKQENNKEGLNLVEIRSKRSEIMNCHGFRKFFDTVCVESDMKYLPKEILMGHKREQGLDRNYYRPTSDKLLNEYLKVVDDLTINSSHRLQKQVDQLQQQDDYNQFIIDKKMKEKDDEIAKLQQNFKTLAESFKQHNESFLIMTDIVKYLNQQTDKQTTKTKRTTRK